MVVAADVELSHAPALRWAGLSAPKFKLGATCNLFALAQSTVGRWLNLALAPTTRFHLRSPHQILATLFPDQPDFLKGLDEVLQRLEFGLPYVALPLTKIPVRLTRGQCLALVSIGVHSADHLKSLDDARLHHCVGSVTAALLRPKENISATGEGEDE